MHLDVNSPLLTLAGIEPDDAVKLIVFGGGIALGALAIIGCTVKSMHKTRQREESRREIAAYVSEGTMTPEQGERLMRADMRSWERGDNA